MSEIPEKYKSALKVNDGVEQPPIINPNIAKKISARKPKQYSISDYVEGICNGDRMLLSKAITLVESRLPIHQEMAQQIIEKCLAHSGKSMRIGITGVPGVGKSTFIESFGMQLIDKGKCLAVLAIDPSSERSGGSILGDKTRMEELSVAPNAFIRPSPSAGSLGGVAQKTRETIILCEAAGFDTIFVETVGVGQSETAVHSMTDFFLLLMLAGAGDELQGIKRGIMEMADAIVITKADGQNMHKSELAQREFKNALHFFPSTESGWKPQVLTCSAVSKQGMENVWLTILSYFEQMTNSGYLTLLRNRQAKYWMHQTIQDMLMTHFYDNADRKPTIKKLEELVLNGKISPFAAASQVMQNYQNIV